MQHIYQNILKEGNGNHKYLRCTDLRDNNNEFMCSEIALDKVDLMREENVKTKPTRNSSGFITYSNTIYFSGIWLDKIIRLVAQWQFFLKEQAVSVGI